MILFQCDVSGPAEEVGGEPVFDRQLLDILAILIPGSLEKRG
jgi:hypothetical protein